MTPTKRQDPRDRQNRVQDFARALPVLGVLLIMLPLIWPQGTEGARTSGAMIYLFPIWAALILLGGLLSLLLRR